MISRRELLKTAVRKVVAQTLAAAVLLNQFNPGVVKAANAPTKFVGVEELNTESTKLRFVYRQNATEGVFWKERE